MFAAWTNHVDSKAINSLDTLVTENGRTVVRHHLIDFGRRWGARRLSLASTMKAIITFPTRQDRVRHGQLWGFTFRRFISSTIRALTRSGISRLTVSIRPTGNPSAQSGVSTRPA